jgi:hypothetical protein
MSTKISYVKLKNAIDKGKVVLFKDAFKYTTVEQLAENLGEYKKNFEKNIEQPECFLFGTVVALADLVGIPVSTMIEIFIRTYKYDEKSRGHIPG